PARSARRRRLRRRDAHGGDEPRDGARRRHRLPVAERAARARRVASRARGGGAGRRPLLAPPAGSPRAAARAAGRTERGRTIPSLDRRNGVTGRERISTNEAPGAIGTYSQALRIGESIYCS